MTQDSEKTSIGTFSVDNAVAAAIRLPGVYIDRDSFLTSELSPHCAKELVEQAVATSPAEAGVDKEVIEKVAEAVISLETTRVTAISAAAGIPGGFALFGTIPADIAQYMAHALRVTQKLAYVYSWPSLFANGEDELDDATKNILVVFLGVMMGVGQANIVLNKISAQMAEQVVKRLPRQALTKGTLYPLVKMIAKYVGVRMNTRIFAKSVSKVVPLIGGVVSGGLTYATFRPQCARLKDHLGSLDLAQIKDDAE